MNLLATEKAHVAMRKLGLNLKPVEITIEHTATTYIPDHERAVINKIITKQMATQIDKQISDMLLMDTINITPPTLSWRSIGWDTNLLYGNNTGLNMVGL